jgi:hypothetical protein
MIENLDIDCSLQQGMSERIQAMTAALFDVEQVWLESPGVCSEKF